MQLSPRDWSRYLDVAETNVQVTQGQWIKVVDEDLDRVVLILGPDVSGVGITFSMVAAVGEMGGTIGGLQTAFSNAQVGGAPFIMDHERHGKLVQLAWYATGTSGGATAITVTMPRQPLGKYQRGLPGRWSTSYEPPES